MVLGVRWGGGVVLVFVRRLRRVVAEEWVTLMSCCPSIFWMGLEREGWKGRATLSEGSVLVCLLKEPMMVVTLWGGNPFCRQMCRTVWSSSSRCSGEQML